MVRIVRRPEGTVEVDRQGRLPGRGAYIHSSSDCLEVARKRLAQVQAGARPSDIAAQRAEIDRLDVELENAQKELGRYQGLRQRNSIAESALDDVRLRAETLTRLRRQANERLTSLTEVRPVDVDLALQIAKKVVGRKRHRIADVIIPVARPASRRAMQPHAGIIEDLGPIIDEGAACKPLAHHVGGVEHKITIGIKLDEEGCYLDDGQKSARIPAAKIKVVDATGAGDTWFGAVMTALIKGMPMEPAGKFANRAAADCCTALGASAGVKSFRQTLARI